MARRRLQILAAGEEIDTRRAHVVEHLVHLERGFTKPDHQTRFGEDLRTQGFDLIEQTQRMIIARTRADGRIKPRHGFKIVIVNIGARIDDHLDGAPGLVAEIRRQDLDRRFRRVLAQFVDDADKLPGAAIDQIITIDRRDDDMFEPQRRRRFGNMCGFEKIDWPRHPGLDVAKGTGARAGIAQDHHRGVLLAPAFADVGARRFLADGVELQPPHQRAGFGKAHRGRRSHPQPIGLADTWFGEGGEIGHAREIAIVCRAANHNR